jgi:hypothetical protein
MVRPKTQPNEKENTASSRRAECIDLIVWFWSISIVRCSPGAVRQIVGVRDHTLHSALPRRYPEGANESLQLSLLLPESG